jgi:hypothetical protein
MEASGQFYCPALLLSKEGRRYPLKRIKEGTLDAFVKRKISSCRSNEILWKMDKI